MKKLNLLIAIIIVVTSCYGQETKPSEFLSVCLEREETKKSFNICESEDTILLVTQLHFDLIPNQYFALSCGIINYQNGSVYEKLKPGEFIPTRVPENLLLLYEFNNNSEIYTIRIWRPYSGVAITYRFTLVDGFIVFENVSQGAF